MIKEAMKATRISLSSLDRLLSLIHVFQIRSQIYSVLMSRANTERSVFNPNTMPVLLN